jgi:hypothetical protein
MIWNADNLHPIMCPENIFDPMRIRTKTALTFATLSVTALLASSLFTYNFARSELTSNALNRLETAASTHANRLHEALEHDRQRCLLITSRTQLRRSLDSFLTTGNTDDQAIISKILNDAAIPIKSFLWIAVLDPQGNIVATSGAFTGDTKLPPQTIARAILSSKPERILLLNEQQRLNQHLIAPLAINGRNIGSVVVQTDSGNMLGVVGDFAGLGASGDSYVLGPATRTDAFQFLTPARFDTAAALRRETESLDGLVGAKALLSSDSALSQGIDYRGQPVFAAATIVQGTDWTLVVKIDQSEVFAPIARLRNFWTAVVVLVLLMVIAVSIYLSRLITQPIVALTQKMDR